MEKKFLLITNCAGVPEAVLQRAVEADLKRLDGATVREQDQILREHGITRQYTVLLPVLRIRDKKRIFPSWIHNTELTKNSEYFFNPKNCY
jgi:hypothetical protein